ncbi:E3 ubiquitin-protein ligase RNF13 [Talaromyces pinophilus]|nr:E3 ubiquitin-protein ligase RNF13 [Talaromyces pinophilus]
MISFCPHLLFLLLLVSSVAASNSVTASPTNDTNALTQQFGSLRFFLSATTNSSVNEVNLAPLTSTLATLDYSSFQRFSIQGALYQTTASNTASITTQNIALISCDPSAYTGYLHVAETVSAVVSLSSGPPAAVILYSLQSNHCNYTVNDPTVSYTNVFTVVNSTASQLFLSQLSNINTTATADINADMSTSSSASTFGNTTTTGSGGTVSGSTTAVAMIILYTITGIITALFLGIIITGAVRAHRHPERYGPRNVTGRPRQSRARGIARAMLETIPIVKFGDKEDGVDAAKRDLEMASSTHTAESHDTTPEPSPMHEADPQPEADHHDHVTDAAAATTATTAAATTPAPADAGNNNCPICTDDFVKGQDVRLLPCGHQFHPDCIDPWLINVSGTCPLCRIDLNPAASTETAENSETAHEEGEITSQTADAVEPSNNQTNSNRHSRGLAGYLSDIRHARNAPVEERIEALRRLRESHQQQQERNGDESATAEESQGRRRHLAMRLRDRFRVRTRQHGSESSP